MCSKTWKINGNAMKLLTWANTASRARHILYLQCLIHTSRLRFQANLSSSVWKLTYLCLTLESSYVLGFDFHIPCINIRYTPQVQRMDWWDLFQTLIAPLRPFQLVYHEVAEPTSPATLSRIIREGNQNLQHVCLDLLWLPEDTRGALPGFLASTTLSCCITQH